MTAKTIQESGTAGKPGEGQKGHRAGAETPPKAELNLTAAGMASLLKSEFAAAEAPDKPNADGDRPSGTPEGQPPNDGADPNAGQPAGEGADENGEGAEGAPAGEPAEGAGPGEGAEGAGEMPPELQSAIEAWEEQGGGQLPPALQTLFEKRIGKVVAQREAEKTNREGAEAKVRELEAEVAQLRAGAEGQGQPLGILGAEDEKVLAQREQTFQRFVDDAQNYLDDTATEEERGRIERYMQANGLDANKLKRMVRDVDRELRNLPAQRQQVRERQAEFRKVEASVEPEVKKFFPWIDDKSDANYQKAQEVLTAIPDLRQRTASHRLVLGIYVLGLNAFEKMRGTAGAGTPAKAGVKPAAKPPAKPPAGSSAAPPAAARANGREAAEEAQRQKFAKAPTRFNAVEMARMDLRS
jgi:hypothetical protein